MRFKMPIKVVVLVFLLIASSAKSEPLTFGIVPQQSAKKLAENWSPILAYISQETGIDIVFATAKDIPTFEQRLALGKYDIAYMNPFHYVVYSEQSGYKALARQQDKFIQGLLIVHRTSSITQIEDLQGLTLAFPAPASFAATIIPQAMLADRGIEINSQYVSSHDSVYLNVARQFLPAGGGVKRTLNSTSKNTQDNIRILWESPKYTPHAIATSPKVTAEQRALILAALLKTNLDANATKHLAKINFTGFIPANHNDWDDVKALNIDKTLVEKAEN